MPSISRLLPVFAGLINYGNPFEIFVHRVFQRDGEMTIVDRRTKVKVRAQRRSYHMFSETWYDRDYDVAGCPIRENDLVVDVGANQGFFTCYAAQKGARVYAFEPNPATFEVLQGNIARNGFAERVDAKCVAVADFEGEADLFCSSFLGGGSDTINAAHAAAVTVSMAAEPGKSISVNVARLSSLIPADARVRLLKLDCEGAESAILRELPNPERFDSIAIEFHPDAYPVESLIKTVLELGTHQVYAWHRQIVHAIRTDVLLEFARDQK